MNDNETILAELRRIGAWADTQRKITKWSFIVIAALVPIMIILGIVLEKRFTTTADDISALEKPGKPTWSDVDWKIRRAEFDEAIRLGEELIQRSPQYPEGHHRLASAYLAAGKAEQAREHYAQAFRLFPSEDNEKSLIAIEKRIKAGNPRPDDPTNRSQPTRSETNRTSSGSSPR